MEFLKYLWETSLREATVKFVASLIALTIMLIVLFSTPLWLLELSRLVCYTGIALAIPIVAIFIVRSWLREKWERYQQVKRWKAGDHSA